MLSIIYKILFINKEYVLDVLKEQTTKYCTNLGKNKTGHLIFLDLNCKIMKSCLGDEIIHIKIFHLKCLL